jgi:hypothetical protein
MSPSQIAASIIDSPWTRNANSTPLPVTVAGSASQSTVFTGYAYTQATGQGIAFGQVAGGVAVERSHGQAPDPS